MENDRDDAWAAELVRRVGRAIKDARGGRSAAWLSERTAELGYRVPATVISKLDSGHRGSVLGVAELVVLAAALDMPPVALLYPDLPDGEVEMLPNRPARSIAAARWFSGEVRRASIEGAVDPAQIDAERENMRRIQLSRRRHELQSAIASTERVAAMAQNHLDHGAEDANPASIHALIDLDRANLDRLATEMSNRGWEVDNDA
ncbi:DNA-binding protein [Mycobacteroides abscessus]|uniref:DNA-binding protein n=1 Tax=Mycobacteroides abscessus TaxID=36809 RepID=UPI00266C0C05|nr:DNA-binding protein [Mycobacteroides abscessus]MDO2969558.1 DNA-binding protein [Mycobacteroides abscessus subsp. bolletii]MDO3079562.1 DNA-binding protein [Mycobacteroides abscessus subsp. bolletii]